MSLLRRRTRGVRAVLSKSAQSSPSRWQSQIWATLASALLSLPALAEVPTAPLHFPFSGDQRIQALEGEEVCEDILLDDVEVERCVGLDLLIDARGHYEGTATVSFSEPVEGTLIGSVRGRQSQRRGDTAFDLRSKLRGVIDLPLIGESRGKGKLRCDGMITAGGTLTGVCEFQLKRPGSRTESQEFDVPAKVIGGNWDVSITTLIEVGGGDLEGSAQDSFGFSYQVRGSYDEDKDRSKLSLRGLRRSLSQGARIDLKDLEAPAPSEGTAESRIKLLGAKAKGQTTAEAPLPPD